MKNGLLYCLAAASLALSFFFERPADASATVRATASAAAEASLFPAMMTSVPATTFLVHSAARRTPPTGTPAVSTPAELAAARDSLTYRYYAQTLGLHLAFDENKDLLRSVTDWIGTPYSYGSNSHRGTDCSGFVSRVFREVYGIT